MFRKQKICYCVAAILLLNGLATNAGTIELETKPEADIVQVDPMPCADQDDPQAKHKSSCVSFCDGATAQTSAPLTALPPSLRLDDGDTPDESYIAQLTPSPKTMKWTSAHHSRRSGPHFDAFSNPIARHDVLLI